MKYLILLLILIQSAWTETTVPTPADPNHVHGSTDSGIGNGGVNNGVNGSFVIPHTVSVFSIDQVPASDDPAFFSAWRGWSIAPGHCDSHNWTMTEMGNMHHGTIVQPWSKMTMKQPTICSAIVMINGWDCDEKIDLSGTVTINGGNQIAISGWHWRTALVVPVPKGIAVSEVLYTAKTVPGNDSSGVKLMWLLK